MNLNQKQWITMRIKGLFLLFGLSFFLESCHAPINFGDKNNLQSVITAFSDESVSIENNSTPAKTPLTITELPFADNDCFDPFEVEENDDDSHDDKNFHLRRDAINFAQQNNTPLSTKQQISSAYFKTYVFLQKLPFYLLYQQFKTHIAPYCVA